MTDSIETDVIQLQKEMSDIRRDFHQFPELGMNVFRTADVVAKHLIELGLDVTQKVGQTGVVGLLKGARPGRTIMLRADMDALPILEKTELPFKSQNDGIMHACGHDGHMAIMLTVAKILSRYREKLAGSIKFVFQPGEEGFGGAKFMIEDGVLENPKVDAALALHLFNLYPCGQIVICPGTAMACMDSFTIRLIGKAGHAARPQNSVDAIVMTAPVISAIQSIISRETNPISPLLIHLGTIQGGDNFNVVAVQVEMSGTVRTFDESIRRSVPEQLKRMIGNITSAYRGSYELDYNFGYPALTNDPVISNLVRISASEIVGDNNVVQTEPNMGSEDFAFFLEKVPGCEFFVGSGNEAQGYTASK